MDSEAPAQPPEGGPDRAPQPASGPGDADEAPRTRAGVKVVVVGMALLAAVGTWLILVGNDRDEGGGRPGGGVIEVDGYVVETREFIAEVEALGTVRARESAEISANVTEVVEELLFEGGQHVEKGDPLARLSSAEEEAALAAAKANLSEQEREVERLEALVADGAVPQIRLEERLTMLEIARQQIAEVEAKLRDRNVEAPFNGVLGLRRISVGALVTPGTVITNLDQIDSVYVDFTVAEAYLADLRHGLTLFARAAAYPDELFEAEVLAVDSRVDPVTRAVEVRAEIDNEGHRLRPGMLLTTRLQRDPRESPGVPERALTQLGERAFVFVVENGDDEDPEVRVARRRNVETGRRIPGWVEILDGVEAGERIVGDGVISLSDGSAIRVVGEFEQPSAPFDPRERP